RRGVENICKAGSALHWFRFGRQRNGAMLVNLLQPDLHEAAGAAGQPRSALRCGEIDQRTKGVRWKTPLRKRMPEELQLRNYADFSIERYLDAVRAFAKFIGKSPDQAGPEQICIW